MMAPEEVASGNRGALARAGAIPQLVKQLKTALKTTTDSGAQTAAAALSNIAMKSADLRVQVTADCARSPSDCMHSDRPAGCPRPSLAGDAAAREAAQRRRGGRAPARGRRAAGDVLRGR